MKMLSIDVGIKNLACVVLEFDEKEFVPSKILKWEVIDLTDRPLCDIEFCNEVAIFQDNKNCIMCRKHAKELSKSESISNKSDENNICLIIPKACDKLKNVKKLKLPELRSYAESHGLSHDKLKKTDLLKKVEEFLKTKYYGDIQSSRADEYDLITLGRKLKTKICLRPYQKQK